MSLRHKALDALSAADLQALVDNQVREDRYIEYKGVLPGGSEREHKEFLADAVSFANANGGHLLFGIEAKEGIPVRLCGLPETDIDAAVLRLENMIRDGIAPRVPGVRAKAVRLDTGSHAILLFIPQSWAQPHLITFKSESRFFSRNSAGKHPMDVTEIRAAFVAAGAADDRIRGFRRERLASMVSGEMPLPLEDGAKIVVHLAPISATSPVSSIDFTPFHQGRVVVPLLDASFGTGRYNFDGYIVLPPGRRGGRYEAYVQFFRNGTIEAVNAHMLRQRDEGPGVIPSLAFEQELIDTLPLWLHAMGELGCEPPVFVGLSLLQVRGYELATRRGPFPDEIVLIDRDHLLMPEVVLESFDVDAGRALRPAFDAVWNAAGFYGSVNYDRDGKWAPRR